MQTKVSVRGQTVIPQEIRQALGITTNTLLYWKVQNGIILLYPLSNDPTQDSLGILKDKGFTLEDFLKERQREREKEKLANLHSR